MRDSRSYVLYIDANTGGNLYPDQSTYSLFGFQILSNTRDPKRKRRMPFDG
jgi:hypothetical protein